MASDNPISPVFGYIVKNDDDETYGWRALRFARDSHPIEVKKPPGAIHTFFHYEDCLAEIVRLGFVINHHPPSLPAAWATNGAAPAGLSLPNRQVSRFWAVLEAVFHFVCLVPLPGAEHTADIKAISRSLKELEALRLKD